MTSECSDSHQAVGHRLFGWSGVVWLVWVVRFARWVRLCFVLSVVLQIGICVGMADDLPGIHNLQCVSDSVLVGSEPEGELAFRSLRDRGVKTIVSVDGAVPDTKLAAKYGLRYIHIPMGYDGIAVQTQLALVRVARELKSPLYVHCHHGRHRGPAAAAVIGRASGVLTAAQATELLERCGTSRDYAALWRDVATFRDPGDDVLLPELPEVAKVESMAAAMAKLDRHFELVKLSADCKWKVPADHPDMKPATESLLVEEGLTECLRLMKNEQPRRFRELMQQSVTQATELAAAVKLGNTAAADKLLQQLTGSCKACHQEFRN